MAERPDSVPILSSAKRSRFGCLIISDSQQMRGNTKLTLERVRQYWRSEAMRYGENGDDNGQAHANGVLLGLTLARSLYQQRRSAQRKLGLPDLDERQRRASGKRPRAV